MVEDPNLYPRSRPEPLCRAPRVVESGPRDSHGARTQSHRAAAAPRRPSPRCTGWTPVKILDVNPTDAGIPRRDARAQTVDDRSHPDVTANVRTGGDGSTSPALSITCEASRSTARGPVGHGRRSVHSRVPRRFRRRRQSPPEARHVRGSRLPAPRRRDRTTPSPSAAKALKRRSAGARRLLTAEVKWSGWPDLN